MKCRFCEKNIPDDALFCCYCGKKQILERSKHKRGNGQGYVYKRGKTWTIARTFDFVMQEGKIKRIKATKGGFSTKAEALAFLPHIKDPRLRKNARERTTNISLYNLYKLWLPSHKAGRSTMDGYKAGFKVFAPVWHMRMEDLDIDDLQECMDEHVMPKGSSGKRTKQNAKTCLNLVYKYGIPRGYVPANVSGEPNLAQFVKVRVKDEGKAKEGFSPEEFAKIEKAVGKLQYAEYVYANCYLGFRPSAFLSLDAADYDRKEKAIRGGIKTEAGINRVVTISPKIQSIIDKLVKDKISGAIFCKEGGEPWTLSAYREMFYELLEKLGIDNPTNEYGQHRLSPHSCRHTFATMMKRIDAPSRDKLELIGHTSEEMLRYYQDVSLDDLRKITDVL